jgi:hypothetical protein
MFPENSFPTGAAPMTLSAVRSHFHQFVVSVQALGAVLADFRDADFDPAVLEEALTELANVQARLEALAERLGEAFDPAADQKG